MGYIGDDFDPAFFEDKDAHEDPHPQDMQEREILQEMEMEETE